MLPKPRNQQVYAGWLRRLAALSVSPESRAAIDFAVAVLEVKNISKVFRFREL